MIAHDGRATLSLIRFGLGGAIAMVALAGVVFGASEQKLPIDIASAIIGFVVGMLSATIKD